MRSGKLTIRRSNLTICSNRPDYIFGYRRVSSRLSPICRFFSGFLVASKVNLDLHVPSGVSTAAASAKNVDGHR
jgi:hypothetical protein